MQNMIRIYLFLLAFMANYETSFAQKRTFEDYNEVQLRNLMPIKHHDEVIGYCMFYYIDNAKEKRMSNYKIVLLDANLNKVAEREFVHLRNIKLYEVAYNGTHLLLVFFNFKNTLFEYFQYDLALNEQSKCTAKLAYSESDIIYRGFVYLGNIEPHIVPFEGEGFAMYSFFNDRFKRKYSITYVSNEGKVLWEVENTTDEGYDVFPIFLAANKDIALNIIRTDEANGFQYKAYNLKTGKNVFLKEIPIDGKKARPMCAKVDAEGNFMVAGLFFENGEKNDEQYPNGCFMATIDTSGKLLRHKLYQWADIQKDKLGLDATGKYKDKGSLMMVKMKVLPNGHFLLIGECFERENTKRNSRLYVNDLVLLEVDQAFNFVSSIVMEKRNGPLMVEPAQLTKSSNFEKLACLSHIVDYRYINADTKGFSIFYQEQIKEGEKGQFWKVLSRQFEEKEYLIDRIQLKSKASTTDVLTAKAGHLLFVEYFKKERKLDLRLEKFNY